PGKECGARGTTQDGSPVADPQKPVCQGQIVTGTNEVTGQTASEKVADVEPTDQPSVWLTILTAMFMHGGRLHIAWNMLFLWIFGNNVEDSMGRPTFIVFYLLGGLAATLVQTVTDPNSAVPNLGASGAIAAVLGGYALLYPRALLLIGLLAFLTVRVAVRDGIDAAVVISLVVLALMGVGVLGALNAPPDE